MKRGHTYEVHVEIKEGDQRVDVWNNETPRVQFAVSNPGSTGVSTIENAPSIPVIYNLQGTRIVIPADRLPKGVYIIDGKKVMR